MRTHIHRARFLWVEPGRVYAPGELRVAGGRVLSVGPARGRSAPPRAILPALVNAHVHLQIPPLQSGPRSFVPWVSAVMRERAALGPVDHLARARAALADLAREGTAAVGEIDSTGASPLALRELLQELPMGGVCYRELTGFDLGPGAAGELVAGRSTGGTRYCRSGLSPHAPYSVSPALFRAAAARGVPLAVHVAETEEELEFLATGRGPFRDLLERLGRLPARFTPPRLGPVAYLRRLGVLGPRTALIHAQHITAAELRTAVRLGAPIVLCPGTIHYFRRNPPPVSSWLEQGATVALGTDSLASNTRLSMRHEMALARRLWPALDPMTVFAMATGHGGRALGRPSTGTLRRGAAANFCSVAMPGQIDECLDAFTADARPCERIWLRGRELCPGG